MRRTHRGFTLIELVVVIGIIAILVGIVLAVGATLAGSQNVARTEATMSIIESSLDEWEVLMLRDLSWGVDDQLGNGSTTGLDNHSPRYDMQEDTLHVFLVSDMLDAIGRSADIRAMLANIDGERYVRYQDAAASTPDWIKEGALASFQATEPDAQAGTWATDLPNWEAKHTILDAWDRPIRVIHCGREVFTPRWITHPTFPPDPPDPLAADDDGTVHTPLEDLYGTARNAKPYFVSAGPDGDFGAVNAPDGTPMKEAARDNIYSYELE